jgi:hypothetical protein
VSNRTVGISLVLSAVWLSCAGCAVAPDEGSTQASDDTNRTVDSELSLTSAACTATRLVGPTIGGVCPVVGKGPTGQYTVTSLGAASLGYCVYDWHPDPGQGAPTAKDIARVPGKPDVDCNVVGALGGTVADGAAVKQPMQAKFAEMAGEVATLPAAGASSPVAVRVAVIDSSPTKSPFSTLGRAVPGTSDHGYGVGRVIRELSCPSDGTGGVCIGQIEAHLALPQLDAKTEDRVSGGYFGSQAQLAQAIVEAVDAWSSRRQGSPREPTRLVINLSVGWDAGRGYETTTNAKRLTPGLPAPPSHPSMAVRRALEHASCKGAIVIAAAGNRSGTPSTGGAMYPAAWEAAEAPGRPACETIEGGAYFEERDAIFPTTSVYRPLLWAASGVDARDRPIAATRDKGIARLVAYADEVTAKDGNGFTRSFTGTSMAAAVVTAVATTAWGYAPTLTPAELMTGIYATGVDLGTAAPSDVATKSPSFCLGQCSSMTIRRVSLGQTLAAMCKGLGCTVVQKTTPAYQGSAPVWPASTWSSLDPQLAQPAEAKPCAPGTCSLPSGQQLTQTAMPWVDPQPGKTGCDVCGVTKLGTTYLVLNPDWWYQHPGSTATLQVTAGNATSSYQLTPQSPTAAYKLGGVTQSAPISSASLSFGVTSSASNTSYATSEPLLLLP